MRVQLDHIEDVTPRIKTFWFRPERRIRYVAGQFTELHLPHEDTDKRGVRRWFTLSSSPSEELLSITTRFDSASGSSFKRQLAALQPGSPLDLADPMGDFVLPKDASIPLLFIAGGLGITPVRSMIKWLHDRGEQRNIQLLYAVPTQEELAFHSLLQSYQLAAFTPVIKKQNDPVITAEQILSLAGESSLIFLSGPELMTETLYKQLRAMGVANERLVTDYFPGYSL